MNIAFKVMILGSPDHDYTDLKDHLRDYHPLSVFVLAEDQMTFERKKEWFAPNLIVSVYDLLDFQATRALTYARGEYPYLPFVFVIKREHFYDLREQITMISEVADAVLFEEELSKLPGYLAIVFKQRHQESLSARARYQLDCQLSLNFQKAVTLLEQTISYPHRVSMIELLKAMRADFDLFRASEPAPPAQIKATV